MRQSPLHSFWFGRFQVLAAPNGDYRFCDWLIPPACDISQQQFAGLADLALQRAFFRFGLVPGALSSFARPVADRPLDQSDVLFWQFPCRTEADAWARHANLGVPWLSQDVLHMYVGLPWATWIDCARKHAFGVHGEQAMRHQLQLLRIRLSGLRQALARLGLELRVHTVCQHIYWRDQIDIWRELGITDVWLSHCPIACPPAGSDPATQGLNLHPWALFAVNVQDPERRVGLQEGKDPANKPVLASFVGAYTAGYLSDARLRLLPLAGEPGFVVKVTGKWHFEDVVYQHQMQRTALAASYAIDDSVASYNRLLSDSVFSLCPSGTGPNTLRLWESLAVGSIPVLMGPSAAMPQGGTLAAIDWERIVLRVSDEDIGKLPDILRNMPMDEIRQRQRLGMQAFALVSQQRCF